MFSFSSPLQQYPYLSSSTYPSPYAPQTPSPLRTSRNANMPAPHQNALKSSPLLSSSPLSTNFLSTEFAVDENARSIPSEQRKYRFEQRARSTSPRVELAARTKGTREQRNKGFLDRLKGRREEERFEGRGEQLLRMDWVRERREWEERLRASAVREAAGGDGDEEMEGLDEEERGGLSPTEEREIEELVGLFDDPLNSKTRDSELLDDEEEEEEDYDRLFTEVMERSQDVGIQHDVAEGSGETTNADAEMDLS